MRESADQLGARAREKASHAGQRCRGEADIRIEEAQGFIASQRGQHRTCMLFAVPAWRQGRRGFAAHAGVDLGECAHDLGRAIRGGVVEHDHFNLYALRRKDMPDGCGNSAFLIAGGNQD